MLQAVTSRPDHVLKYSVHTRLREYHLRRLMPALDRGRLLDVGCGLGYLTQVLGRGLTAVGLDSDYKSLVLNRRQGAGSFVQGDAAGLPFKEASFDLAVCSEMLEHLPPGLDEQCLAEMARVVKPGGRILITLPSLEGLRAMSRLRNLGHDDPQGGEFHHRPGYAWPEIKALIDRCPFLRVSQRKYSMFLLSEMFMDLLKLVYLKKEGLREHSDIAGAGESPLFKVYRLFFPLLHFIFICEDLTLSRLFKGHILVLALERTGQGAGEAWPPFSK
ncbi:MAG: class I SAM-dependent methyltransferase [Deltaproteobacteria bacterium]|nr:class I SAM-dependent methyltransferase [Deltaproteobacteria bacterium]